MPHGRYAYCGNLAYPRAPDALRYAFPDRLPNQAGIHTEAVIAYGGYAPFYVAPDQSNQLLTAKKGAPYGAAPDINAYYVFFHAFYL
jgi:hypothetical protein